MIHVCYGLYDKDGRYSKFVGTSMLSLFENTTSAVTIHILHDNTLSEENRDKFIYMTGRYSQTVKFYNVEKLFPEKIASFQAKMRKDTQTFYSIASIYRLIIPQIFPFSKIIYLDADTIVNLDIKELWQIDLKSTPFGAIPGFDPERDERVENKMNYLVTENLVSYEDYFGSGILLMNLPALRDASKIIDEGIKFVSNSNCLWFDQDILNYCFSKNYLKLPRKFNSPVNRDREKGIMPHFEKKIFHYVWITLDMNVDDSLNKLFFEYFAKTPWFGVDTVAHVYESIRQIYAEQKNFAVQISKFVAGKKRVFFVEQNISTA